MRAISGGGRAAKDSTAQWSSQVELFLTGAQISRLRTAIVFSIWTILYLTVSFIDSPTRSPGHFHFQLSRFMVLTAFLVILIFVSYLSKPLYSHSEGPSFTQLGWIAVYQLLTLWVVYLLEIHINMSLHFWVLANSATRVFICWGGYLETAAFVASYSSRNINSTIWKNISSVTCSLCVLFLTAYLCISLRIIVNRTYEGILTLLILKEKTEDEATFVNNLIKMRVPEEVLQAFASNVTAMSDGSGIDDENRSSKWTDENIDTKSLDVEDGNVPDDEKKYRMNCADDKSTKSDTIEGNLIDSASECGIFCGTTLLTTPDVLIDNETEHLLKRAFSVVIAVNITVGEVTPCLHNFYLNCAGHEILAEVARKYKITYIRSFGKIWVGSIGLFYSWGNVAKDARQAVLFACDVSACARRKGWNMRCAIDCGKLLGGFFKGQMTLDLLGAEVRTAMSTADQDGESYGIFASISLARMMKHKCKDFVFQSHSWNTVTKSSARYYILLQPGGHVTQEIDEILLKADMKSPSEANTSLPTILLRAELDREEGKRLKEWVEMVQSNRSTRHAREEKISYILQMKSTEYLAQESIRLYNDITSIARKHLVVAHCWNSFISFAGEDVLGHPLNDSLSPKSSENIPDFHWLTILEVLSMIGTLLGSLLRRNMKSPVGNLHRKVYVDDGSNVDYDEGISETHVFSKGQMHDKIDSDSENLESARLRDMALESRIFVFIAEHKMYLQGYPLHTLLTVFSCVLPIFALFAYFETMSYRSSETILAPLVAISIGTCGLLQVVFEGKSRIWLRLLLVISRTLSILFICGNDVAYNDCMDLFVITLLLQLTYFSVTSSSFSGTLLDFFAIPITFYMGIIFFKSVVYYAVSIALLTAGIVYFLWVHESSLCVLHAIERILVPTAYSKYEKMIENRVKVHRKMFRNVSNKQVLMSASHKQCKILALNVKAAALLPGMADKEEATAYLSDITEVIDACLDQCGIPKVTSFAGMHFAVLFESTTHRNDKIVQVSTQMSVVYNALQSFRVALNEYSLKYKIHVDLSFAIGSGSAIVALSSKSRWYLDLEGDAWDDVCKMIAHEGEGITTTETITAELLRIQNSLRMPEHIITVAQRMQGPKKSWVGLVMDGNINRTDSGLDNFEYLSMLGSGGYGSVHLLKVKGTEQKYAIKSVRRELDGKADELIRREFNIFSKLKHPNVVDFLYCMVRSTRIFLVLAYMRGGNLKEVTERCDPDLETLKFWFSELVLAVEYIHSRGIMHRDIKPANCMIDLDGHLRLCDFGLSKFVGDLMDDGVNERMPQSPNTGSMLSTVRKLYPLHSHTTERKPFFSSENNIVKEDSISGHSFQLKGVASHTYTGSRFVTQDDSTSLFQNSVVGTLQFMAPEVLTGKKYFIDIDWWSTGVTYYVSAVRTKLFTATDRKSQRREILEGKIDVSKLNNISHELNDLVSGLLQRDRELRLGATGVSQIKSHDFFKGIDWETISQSEASFKPPQFIPKIEISRSDAMKLFYGNNMECDPDQDIHENTSSIPHRKPTWRSRSRRVDKSGGLSNSFFVNLNEVTIREESEMESMAS
jgi:serine/threonine protein kinase